MDGRDGDDDVGVLAARGALMVDENEGGLVGGVQSIEGERDGMKKTDKGVRLRGVSGSSWVFGGLKVEREERENKSLGGGMSHVLCA